VIIEPIPVLLLDEIVAVAGAEHLAVFGTHFRVCLLLDGTLGTAGLPYAGAEHLFVDGGSGGSSWCSGFCWTGTATGTCGRERATIQLRWCALFALGREGLTVFRGG